MLRKDAAMSEAAEASGYRARKIAEIDNGPGRWHSIRVGVVRVAGDSEELIGEYVRNYPNLLDTFCAFEKDGKSYALYSPDYTVTRVMELPSCKDIGGEESHPSGFCPIAYYVPAYIDLEITYSGPSDTIYADGKVLRTRKNKATAEDLRPISSKSDLRHPKTGGQMTVASYTRPISPLTFYPFGFVAGCVWGDDSSWKIEYLDLQQVSQGIIRRDDRFGYIELPDNMQLADAIDMSDYMYDPAEDDAHCFRITIRQKFDLRTGERAPP